MSYAVAPGHNVALNDLVAVRCRNGELRVSARRYGIGGLEDVGLYSAPVFDVIRNYAAYQTELTKFGLWTVTSAPVTWYTQNDLYEWRRYNGTAIRPQPVEDGRLERYFLRQFVIMVRELMEVEV